MRRQRADIAADGGDGKYKLVAGSTPLQLWNGDALITPTMRAGLAVALITGGEFDAMVALQHAPIQLTCVTLGGEAAEPTPEVIASLEGLRVIVALDSDAQGDAGAAKWLAALPGSTRAHTPTGKDITDLWRAGGDAAVSAWLRKVAGMSTDTPATAGDDDNAAIIDWLFSAGYEPRYGADGRIVAARAEDVPA